jgi:hypothetical protein
MMSRKNCLSLFVLCVIIMFFNFCLYVGATTDRVKVFAAICFAVAAVFSVSALWAIPTEVPMPKPMYPEPKWATRGHKGSKEVKTFYGWLTKEEPDVVVTHTNGEKPYLLITKKQFDKMRQKVRVAPRTNAPPD